MGQPFQIAQHHSLAVLLRQAADLFMEHPVRIIERAGDPVSLAVFGLRRHLGVPPLVTLPSRLSRPRAGGHAQRHAVEPRTDRAVSADRLSAARQDQERRLKGILGPVRIAQHRAAGTQNHRPMALDQSREGDFGGIIFCAAPAGKPLQEFAVAEAGRCARMEEGRKIPRRRSGWSTRHGLGPPASRVISLPPVIVTRTDDQSHFFGNSGKRHTVRRPVVSRSR